VSSICAATVTHRHMQDIPKQKTSQCVSTKHAARMIASLACAMGPTVACCQT